MKSLFFFSIMTNGDSDYTPIDKEEYIMATWKNLDTLSSYDKLSGLKNHVDIATAMSGEQGKELQHSNGCRFTVQLRSKRSR